MYYIYFDDEFLIWCVVNEQTEHCNATFCDREEAVSYCNELNKSLSEIREDKQGQVG